MKPPLIPILGLLSCPMLIVSNAVSSQRSAQELVETLREDEESTARAAQELLVSLGPEAVSPLRKSLDDANFRLRRRSAETLGRIGPPAKRAAPELVILLGDPQIEVQS